MRGRDYNQDTVLHLYQKTENGFLLFYTVSDYLVFFTTICCHARKRKIRLYGIAPMQDHFHIMADADRREKVSDFMRDSTSRYALALNASIHSSGRIFHKSFGSAEKKGDKAIRTCASYLYNNAGEKKLCTRAENYRWTFLAYAKSKHPFSNPLVHKEASKAFRRIIKMVDYYSGANIPLEYAWLGRWFSELDSAERQQLTDYIIVAYNCIDYEKLFSYYDNSYDTACLAFASNQGSEYDIKEDFVPGSHIPYLEIPKALKKYHGIDNPKSALWLPDDQRANLLCDLAMETHASIRQLKKYLRLTDGE